MTLHPRLFFVLAALAALLRCPSAQAATGDDARFSRCAALTLGVFDLRVKHGKNYGYDFPSDSRRSSAVPVLDGAFGYCGSYFDVAGRVEFIVGSDVFFVAPSLLLRVHTRSPVRDGFEAGLALRVGPSWMHVSHETTRYASFTSFGVAAGPTLDGRYWLDERWGISVEGGVGVAGQSGSGPYEKQFAAWWGFSGGPVARF
jgi:hypothetical protein